MFSTTMGAWLRRCMLVLLALIGGISAGSAMAQAKTITYVTISPSSVYLGQQITLTGGFQQANSPSGGIFAFYLVNQGQTLSFGASIVNGASSQFIAVGNLPPSWLGTSQIYATYSGDANNPPVTSADAVRTNFFI